MFTEHNFIIWGAVCSCGKENFILQNNFHPWVETNFAVKLECGNCHQELLINQEKASQFYNSRIYKYFDDVKGEVLDIGCGGGFISSYLASKKEVSKIYAIDKDSESIIQMRKVIHSYGQKIAFETLDANSIKNRFANNSIDYIVNRDVFMFIEDTDQYFNDITQIARKGLRQLGWYQSNNERMKNNLKPVEIVNELKSRGWKVQIEYLNWYKSGYFIKADKS